MLTFLFRVTGLFFICRTLLLLRQKKGRCTFEFCSASSVVFCQADLLLVLSDGLSGAFSDEFSAGVFVFQFEVGNFGIKEEHIPDTCLKIFAFVVQVDAIVGKNLL